MTLLAILYFVGLGISWDLLRGQLALVFLFITLTLLQKEITIPQYNNWMKRLIREINKRIKTNGCYGVPEGKRSY